MQTPSRSVFSMIVISHCVYFKEALLRQKDTFKPFRSGLRSMQRGQRRPRRPDGRSGDVWQVDAASSRVWRCLRGYENNPAAICCESQCDVNNTFGFFFGQIQIFPRKRETSCWVKQALTLSVWWPSCARPLRLELSQEARVLASHV